MENYTVEEVATLFRVHISTVRRWINLGRVQAIRLPGGVYRIPKAAVDRLRQPLTVSR
jgi:excisionase family DNA binding protein